MRTLLYSGAVMAALLCAPLGAEEAGPPEPGQRPDAMTALDTDGSGGVSLAEFEASKRHQMAVQAGHAEGFAEAFAAADADGNAELSADEMAGLHRAMRARHFARIDADGDGELTEAEMKAFHDARRAERGEGRGPGDGAGHGQGQGQGHGQGPHAGRGAGDDDRRPDPGERFRAADTDGSGGLSLEEFLALPQPPKHGYRPHGRSCRGGPQAEG